MSETGFILPNHRPSPVDEPQIVQSHARSLWARFMAFRSNPKIVEKTPLVTTFLLEAANIQQLWRMWTQWTAAGQSMTAWLSVQAALWLWLNFYFVFNRQNKFAIYGTAVGVGLNMAVVLTVAFFRYILHQG